MKWIVNEFGFQVPVFENKPIEDTEWFNKTREYFNSTNMNNKEDLSKRGYTRFEEGMNGDIEQKTVKQIALEKASQFADAEVKPETYGRRSGRTTRMVDSLIQWYFREGYVICRDHHDSEMAHRGIAEKVRERLRTEHNFYELKIEKIMLNVTREVFFIVADKGRINKAVEEAEKKIKKASNNSFVYGIEIGY